MPTGATVGVVVGVCLVCCGWVGGGGAGEGKSFPVNGLCNRLCLFNKSNSSMNGSSAPAAPVEPGAINDGNWSARWCMALILSLASSNLRFMFSTWAACNEGIEVELVIGIGPCWLGLKLELVLVLTGLTALGRPAPGAA